MQILPAIDIRGGKCVRLKQGDYGRETVFSDDPVVMARRWADAGAERLHLVDLDGAREGRPVNFRVVGRIVEATGIPCQLGGGIREESAIQGCLEQLGVDRVILGTGALKDPDWFREMASEFPSRLVLGLDARDGMVATQGWLDISETPAIDLARRFSELDLAAVIYTNISRDGMLEGLDDTTVTTLLELTELAPAVIASGGVSTLDDVDHLAQLSRSHTALVGAIIGRALYEGTIDLAEAIRVAGAPTESESQNE